MDTHQFVTQIFTIGEIAYLFIIIYLLATNRNQFDASASPIINRCVVGLVLVTIDGICMNLGS